MKKKQHPEHKFFIGAMVGSTVGALSAMMFTTKKGRHFQKKAMAKYHEIENYVKHLVQGKIVKKKKHTVKRKPAAKRKKKTK